MPDSIASAPHTTETPMEDSVEWEDVEADDLDDLERKRRQMRKQHWTMLRVSLGVILLSGLMQVQDETRVAFRGWADYPLPELCGSRLLFGTDCPGCGLTRSFLSLARGDWEASLRFHRIGWVLALATVLQIPYRIYRLRELDSKVPDARWPVWFGNGLIALLILNWLIKLAVPYL